LLIAHWQQTVNHTAAHSGRSWLSIYRVIDKLQQEAKLSQGCRVADRTASQQIL